MPSGMLRAGCVFFVCQHALVSAQTRGGRQLLVCAWPVQHYFHARERFNRNSIILEAPATYAGDCGFTLNTTGMSATQNNDLGKLRATLAVGCCLVDASTVQEANAVLNILASLDLVRAIPTAFLCSGTLVACFFGSHLRS